MQLRTSWFNPALFRKNLTRFWPIWVLYGAIWTMILPATMFSEYLRENARSGAVTQGNIDSLVMNEACSSGIFLAFGFGCIAALAVFSYLYQNRSSVAMHSFPLRRECLFVTNYVSGLAFFVLPLAAVFLLTLAVEALAGAVNASGLLVWLTAQIGYVLFFYSFAVFCAMFTGNGFAMPIFYGILSVLTPAMAMMADATFQTFVYGYTTSGRLNGIAEIFSPLLNLYEHVHLADRVLDGGTLLYYMTGWGWIILYALAGLALAVAALLVYRRRRVESAGDVVSVALVRPLFRYGVAVCAALTFSPVLFDILFPTGSLHNAAVILVLLVLFGGAGYFVAQMLLDKSFRVFVRHWKGFAGLALVLAAVVGTIYFDPLQMVYTIPSADRVAAVSLAAVYTYPDGNENYRNIQDPDVIRQTLDLHRTVLDRRNEIQRQLQQFQMDSLQEENYYGTENGGFYTDDVSTYYFELWYTLDNGRTTRRSYEIYVSPAELADPDSPAAKLLGVLNSCAQVEGFCSGALEEQVVQADVGRYDRDWTWRTVTLDQDEARLLYRAALADWENGTLGRRWLTRSQTFLEENNLVSIDFRLTEKDEEGEPSLRTESVTLQIGAENTAEALRTLGVLDEDHPLRTELEERLHDNP